MAGYHKLRARRAGSRRHIDLHVQFRSGTSLEQAHALAHELRDAIAAEFPSADVLIHVEPEGSYRGPADEAGPRGSVPDRSGEMGSSPSVSSKVGMMLICHWPSV